MAPIVVQGCVFGQSAREEPLVPLSGVLDALPGEPRAFETVDITIRYENLLYNSHTGDIVLQGSCLSMLPFNSPTGSWIVEHASYEAPWTRAAGPLAASTLTSNSIRSSYLSRLPSSTTKPVRVRANFLDSKLAIQRTTRPPAYNGRHARPSLHIEKTPKCRNCPSHHASPLPSMMLLSYFHT
jgi:hypothetical protein